MGIMESKASAYRDAFAKNPLLTYAERILIIYEILMEMLFQCVI